MSKRGGKKQTIEILPVKTRASKSKDVDVAQRVAAQVSLEFNSRFSRIEKAIEALAIANRPTEPAGNKRKHQQDPDLEHDQPRPKAKRTPSQAAGSAIPSINSKIQQIEAPVAWLPAGAAIPEHAHQSATCLLAPKPVTSQYATQQEVQAHSVNNPRWSSWMVDNMNTARNDTVPLPLLARDISPNDDIHAKVQEVLNSTASRVNKPSKTGEFPYQYVLRGPEKRKATINSVSLPEHI